MTVCSKSGFFWIRYQWQFVDFIHDGRFESMLLLPQNLCHPLQCQVSPHLHEIHVSSNPHGPICTRDLWSPFPIKFWNSLITLEIVFYQGKINKEIVKTKSASSDRELSLLCSSAARSTFHLVCLCSPSGFVCGVDPHEIFHGK